MRTRTVRACAPPVACGAWLTALALGAAIENPEFLDDGKAEERGYYKEAGGPRQPWLLPKIHNSPACLSGRHGR